MKRFKGNETVAPGLYFNLRQLSFKSMEHEGRLPGTEAEVYHGVPWFVLMFAGPFLGLIYVIFLPFIGLAMVLWLLAGKTAELIGSAAASAVRVELIAGAATSAVRVLRPGWEPSMAFLSRSKRKSARAPKKSEDEWVHEVRNKLEETDRDDR
jgi:hypothetical protein